MKIVVIAAALILAACSGAETRTRANDEWAEAREYVLAALRDPDSARFGAFSHGKDAAVCGSVNSKNGLGGYTGAEPFLYLPAGAGVDRLYVYEYHGHIGDWDERGRLAEIFQAHGCNVGPDHAKALNAIQALRKSAEEFERQPAEPAAPQGEPELETETSEAPNLCWQDYCPCDPPQGGSDQMLCRRLRAGLPVDDELMSAGAGMRDAREQLDEWERKNPGY